jgi:hypothetical protein
MRAHWSKTVILCAVAAAMACGKAREGDHAPVPSTGRVLGEAEILASKANNMYDVIGIQRPEWLRRSGSRPTSLTEPPAEIVVYVDGQRYGPLEALARLSPTAVRYAEYLSASEAHARFGGGNLGGVIHVHTQGTGR